MAASNSDALARLKNIIPDHHILDITDAIVDLDAFNRFLTSLSKQQRLVTLFFRITAQNKPILQQRIALGADVDNDSTGYFSMPDGFTGYITARVSDAAIKKNLGKRHVTCVVCLEKGESHAKGLCGCCGEYLCPSCFVKVEEVACEKWIAENIFMFDHLATESGWTVKVPMACPVCRNEVLRDFLVPKLWSGL